MRASTLVMIAVAVVFGGLAVFVSKIWLDRQAEQRLRSLEAQKRPVAAQTVVVAKSTLRFGNELTPQVLRELPWPTGAVPEGSFSSINELLAGGKRVVLNSIEANEPIVGAKITGPGQKATLSAVIHEGMKAVTVRVNDVDGVAGFVLPGDRVDVLVTRRASEEGAVAATATDVVLQNVKVLAVDQLADERADKPTLAKAVTLEVDTVSAQKIALAASVGNMSLALRRAGDVNHESNRRVTITDIGSDSAASPATPRSHATITVIRAAKKEEYSVPVENDGRVARSAGSEGLIP